MVTGERIVTCTGCGNILRVHRVRRHRQGRPDSIAYYGSTLPFRRVRNSGQEPTTSAATRDMPLRPGWAIPVRRVEALRESPDEQFTRPGGGISSRLRAWLKVIPIFSGDLFEARRFHEHSQIAIPVQSVGLQGIRFGGREVSELPVFSDGASRLILGGVRVKVGPNRPDGKPHPHAGKVGRITKLMDTYSEPYWLGLPAAMIELDARGWTHRFICVSVECLEMLPKIHP
jgi:hypothetical protein